MTEFSDNIKSLNQQLANEAMFFSDPIISLKAQIPTGSILGSQG